MPDLSRGLDCAPLDGHTINKTGRKMFPCKLASAMSAFVCLAGCGLQVPSIQEVGGREEGQRLVQAVVTNINCELRDAFAGLREAHPNGTFLDDWGVQTTLTLNYNERGALEPGASWVPGLGNKEFTLGIGLSAGSEATRTNVINAYFLVSDLDKARCSQASRPQGPFLLQSDLKLSEWLFAAVSASMTNTVDFGNTSLAVKENVLQHEVKFSVETEASVTPTWRLARLSVNQSGNFLSFSRKRTHDLLITLAPAVRSVVDERTKSGRRLKVVAQPIRQGADLHFSSSVANSIQTGIRNALGRQ